jgi:hypothetical protein
LVIWRRESATTVAYVGDRDLAVLDGRGDHSRRHAAAGPLQSNELAQICVRRLHGLLKSQATIDRLLAGQIMVQGAFGSVAAGHLSCIGSANTVGQDVEPPVLLNFICAGRLVTGDKVLIMVANLPAIRSQGSVDMSDARHKPVIIAD